MRTPIVLAALACAAALGACGGDEAKPAASTSAEAERSEESTATEQDAVESEAPAADAAALDPTQVGKIRGVVSFSGEAPARKEIAMGAVAGCPHDAPTLSEDLIVTDGKLANVFVRVKSVRGVVPPPAPAEPAVLDQHGCMYRPHVLGLRVGQKLVVKNSDPATHNVNARPQRPKNPALNRTQPPGTQAIEMEFGDPEVMVPVGCDIHPWMKAWVGAVDHPWFDVTGEDGAFEISGVPPGKHELEFWHEKLGRKKADVTVPPNGEVSADQTFAAK